MTFPDASKSKVEQRHSAKNKSLLAKIMPPDIFDAVYAFSNEEMNILGLPPTSLQKKGILTRLLAFTYWMLREIYSRLTSKIELKKIKLTNATVFFYASLNEKNALESVASQTNKSVSASVGMGDENTLNLTIPYLLSLLYSPWVVFNYIKAGGYQRRSFSYALDQYLLASGYVVYLRFILSRYRPVLTVVSNDHSMFSRSFALVCCELGIPVAYIQHASVSNKFPKLIFDYAFLDGIDALEKYMNKGLGSCSVFLSGISKLDNAFNKLNPNRDERVGIAVCPNSLDDLNAVIDVAQYIQQNIGNEFKVCLRPHPGDTRRFAEWKKGAERIGISYSDSAVEQVSDLITKSCFVVAADSNILLEAALLKATPISMPFTGEILDHYGFVRKGVAIYAQDPNQVIEIFNTEKNNLAPYYAAKHFSHLVGTSYEGTTSKLIALTLDELALGKAMPSVWRSYANGVYEVHSSLDIQHQKEAAIKAEAK